MVSYWILAVISNDVLQSIAVLAVFMVDQCPSYLAFSDELMLRWGVVFSKDVQSHTKMSNRSSGVDLDLNLLSPCKFLGSPVYDTFIRVQYASTDLRFAVLLAK